MMAKTTMMIMMMMSIMRSAAAVLPSLPRQNFPVHIGGEGHIVQGRISADANPGSRVPVDFVIEGRTDADQEFHLRVEVTQSVYTRPLVYDPDIRINDTDPKNPQFTFPTIKFPNSTLPPGMKFVVSHTSAFTVDDDRYIVVRDLDGIAVRDTERLHFEVILRDDLSSVPYVSNHLPFVVEVESTYYLHLTRSAISVAVLVLVIVIMSLIIPFAVRAKRRSKAGKPICGCGSASDGSDASSVDGVHNLAMALDNGRLMHQRPSIGPNTTIQNAQMRSTSTRMLQPTYQSSYHSPGLPLSFLNDPSISQPPTHVADRPVPGLDEPSSSLEFARINFNNIDLQHDLSGRRMGQPAYSFLNGRRWATNGLGPIYEPRKLWAKHVRIDEERGETLNENKDTCDSRTNDTNIEADLASSNKGTNGNETDTGGAQHASTCRDDHRSKDLN